MSDGRLVCKSFEVAMQVDSRLYTRGAWVLGLRDSSCGLLHLSSRDCLDG